MAVEIEGLRYLEQIDRKDFWRGGRTFLTTPSAAPSESRSLWGQKFPGVGSNAPICKRTRAVFHPQKVSGVALIRAFYETARVEGKAIVYGEVRSRMRKLMRDADGKIIEGPDDTEALGGADSDYGVWRVVNGDNRIEEYYTVLRVETAFARTGFDLSVPLGLEGKVNDAPLTLVGFGTMGAEKCKCLGVKFRSEYGADLINLDYYLQWSGPNQTWNEGLESQLGAWMVEYTPLFEKSAAGLGYKGLREAVQWRPKEVHFVAADDWSVLDTAPQPRTPYGLADFSQLQGLTEWETGS